MDIAEHINVLQAEGDRMAEAVAAAGAGSPVPSCPDWVVRDLVHHQGGVHRWATAYVAGAKTEASDVDFEAVQGPMPSDAALASWFADGHAALVAALRGADPDLQCWSFLPAPSPLAMWARRQAHETAIHRVDAEQAAGLESVGVTPAFGADGIDELLMLFAPRRKGNPNATTPRTMDVTCDDAPGGWRVTVSSEKVSTARLDDVDDAVVAARDCHISGPAGRLYHTLWNRLPVNEVTVRGEAEALDLFLDRTKIRWSP